MKKIIISLLVIIIIALGAYLIFREKEAPDPIFESSYIIGQIYEIDDNKILLAEGIEGEYDGFIDGFLGEAGWFTIQEETELIGLENEEIVFKNLRIGNKVEVWVRGPVLDSYPIQAFAERIVIIEEGEEINDIVKNCYVGGCAGELCTDDPEMPSTCELLPGMECLKEEMSCELVNDECTWVLSEKAATCFMEIKRDQGDQVAQTRIKYLFDIAEEFFSY